VYQKRHRTSAPCLPFCVYLKSMIFHLQKLLLPASGWHFFVQGRCRFCNYTAGSFFKKGKKSYPLKVGWNCIAEVLFGAEKKRLAMFPNPFDPLARRGWAFCIFQKRNSCTAIFFFLKYLPAFPFGNAGFRAASRIVPPSKG